MTIECRMQTWEGKASVGTIIRDITVRSAFGRVLKRHHECCVMEHKADISHITNFNNLNVLLLSRHWHVPAVIVQVALMWASHVVQVDKKNNLLCQRFHVPANQATELRVETHAHALAQLQKRANINFSLQLVNSHRSLCVTRGQENTPITYFFHINHDQSTTSKEE